MKRFFKVLSAAVTCVCAAALMTITAYAEDYIFDTSSAKQTTGAWGQSFICYTALNGAENADSFNPLWMTPDSEVIIDYTYEGETSSSPADLIWQTWENGPNGINPDAKGEWNKIAPYEFTDTQAKFSFADIVAAYGTDNFDTVYAICVGDSGVKLTVTGMTVTNCSSIAAPAQTEAETQAEETETEAEEAEAEEVTEAEETEAETEKVTTVVTTAAEEEASIITTTESIAANAPQDNEGSLVLIVVAIVVVAAIAVVAIVLIIKKSKGKYY